MRSRTPWVIGVLLLGASVVLPQPVRPEQTPGFVVVASGAVSVPTDPDACKHLVRALWLRRLREWPDGTGAEPVSRGDGSDEDRALARHVLDMSVTDLERHWTSLKQRTGQTRPREVRYTSAAIEVLRHEPGAFTVLERTGELRDGSGLTVVLTFP